MLKNKHTHLFKKKVTVQNNNTSNNVTKTTFYYAQVFVKDGVRL